MAIKIEILRSEAKSGYENPIAYRDKIAAEYSLEPTDVGFATTAKKVEINGELQEIRAFEVHLPDDFSISEEIVREFVKNIELLPGESDQAIEKITLTSLKAEIESLKTEVEKIKNK